MAFSVKSIVKKRSKAKKHPKKQVQLDRIAYDNITNLRKEISLNPSKDHSSKFSRIVRQFFMGLLKIKHHFTYEEFIQDIKKKRLPSDLKKEMADFFKELSELEYKQQSYSVAELDAMIRIFESIVPRVMAEKRGRVKEKELTKFEKIIDKLHLHDLHMPAQLPKAAEEIEKQTKPKKESIKLAKKKKLKKKQSSELKHSFEISKLFKRKPKDNLLYVYDLIGESYKAILDKKIELANSNIKEIESILPILHTSEVIEIKKDLKKLKSEISLVKKSLKEDISLPLPKPAGKIKKEKKKKIVVERKPLFTKKISEKSLISDKPEFPELVPLPDLKQPIPTKVKEKVKLDEIPLPPLPELDLPEEPVELREVEGLPKIEKEPKKQFNLFSKKDEIKDEKVEVKKKKKIELPPLSSAPDFVPKVKEVDEIEEMFKPEPLKELLPTQEPIAEPKLEPEPVIEKKDIPKVKKFELDISEVSETRNIVSEHDQVSEEQSSSDDAQKAKLSDKSKILDKQSSSDDAQISEGKKPSDDAQKPKVSDKSEISDKPEIEYFPKKFTKDSPSEPSEETLKAISESEPVVFPTAEDINLLSLGSINKEGGSFKPKRIFVPAEDGSERVIKPKVSDKSKQKSKLTKAKTVKTKPLIEEREKQEEILAKIEDLENLIMTAQQMINLKNYSEAKNTYSQALDAKKSLKLKKSDSKKIDYDLQGIDLDLKIAGMT